jgi:hypothetical protein
MREIADNGVFNVEVGVGRMSCSTEILPVRGPHRGLIVRNGTA